jgi:hypothetical protein
MLVATIVVCVPVTTGAQHRCRSSSVSLQVWDEVFVMPSLCFATCHGMDVITENSQNNSTNSKFSVVEIWHLEVLERAACWCLFMSSTCHGRGV